MSYKIAKFIFILSLTIKNCKYFNYYNSENEKENYINKWNLKLALDNFEPFTAFYNDNFDRKPYFLINGEGYGTYFYRFVYTRIFEHIITHSFHNFDIFIFNQNENVMFSLSKNESI